MPSSVVYAAIAVLVIVLVIVLRSRGSSSAKLGASKPARVLRSYTMDEVSGHNTESDMWIVVKYGSEARVYDITEYCDMHPGGDVIYDSAGKDATEKFNGPQHPPTVHDLIREYHIGWLEGCDGGHLGGGDLGEGDAERNEKKGR